MGQLQRVFSLEARRRRASHDTDLRPEAVRVSSSGEHQRTTPQARASCTRLYDRQTRSGESVLRCEMRTLSPAL